MAIIYVTKLRSLPDKSIGLIGKNRIEPVAFTTRWGIHTFGVRYPIDVLILDNSNRVVKRKKNLRPNRIFAWNPKYSQVIEFPEGTIEEKKIKIGEKIILKTLANH